MVTESKKRKYRTIKWRDHKSDGIWMDKHEIAKWAIKPIICTTVGEVTYEDKNVIVLSSTFDGEDDYGDNMCILKKNIVK